jgi:hypothetical protein
MFAVGEHTSASSETTKVKDGEGSTDDNPITLHHYKSDDFANFLWMFYNRYVPSVPLALIIVIKF